MPRTKLKYLRDTDSRTADKHIIALYECECGRIVEKSKSRVKNGYTLTCGDRIHAPKPNLTHGRRHTPEYRIWNGVKNRMLNPNSKDYDHYGAKYEIDKDIAESFEAFLAEVGERPSPNHEIDRIDTRKGYVKGNMRWADKDTQANNRLDSYIVTIGGMTFDGFYNAARHFGRSEMTIRRWCHGFYDKRRDSYTPPRKDCSYERRYN